MAGVSGSQAIGFIIGPGELTLTASWATTRIIKSYISSTGPSVCSLEGKGLVYLSYQIPLQYVHWPWLPGCLVGCV